MQARNFTTNVPKILDLKSSSEQIFFRKLSLGAPDFRPYHLSVDLLACYVSHILSIIGNPLQILSEINKIQSGKCSF